MKLLVIAAFIAVVSSGQLGDQLPQNREEFPWQTGKKYVYDVSSHTLSRLHEGSSSGFAFKTQFIIRVKSPGLLQAKLQDPQHGPFHQELRNNMELPSDLKYESVHGLDKPFEITVEGGRIQSIKLPSSLTISHENLLKGLLSALQVDLSTYNHINSHQNNLDTERHQGFFKKIETDVTGDCETLYSVSPVTSEWRRELPKFASEEDPMEITKSRNYGHCHHRVAYHFGVPEGSEWPGTAYKYNKKQFIAHNSVSRFLVGIKGPIYKAETTSTVHVHPHVYGKQKAEVHSYIKLELTTFEQDTGVEWEKPESSRQIRTLLFAMSTKQVAMHDQSSSASSEESHEHINVQYEEAQKPTRQSYNRESDISSYYKSYFQSSSASDSSAYINDDMPKLNEPVYAAIYMNSESRADKTQSPMDVQKLLLDIAQQLQNPTNMPKSDFLSKFNILVRYIASMSTNSLAQTSRKMEVSRTSDKIVARDIWMIYRDAVVQAGTPQIFQQIRTWIKNKVIQNEEAAQVISLLAKSLRYPTKEIMTQFFDLAMSPEVQEQKYLNSSALIAATTFIRMGHVDNQTAHRYYPTQMYGRLAPRHDRFVLDDILPRLSEKLKQSVEDKEWSKTDLYIKAIGNLGHPEIVRVFTPYLEGRTPVTTYLRVQIISVLRLVYDNNKYLSPIFYRIMRNTAEPYEVRVAAILNLFRAHPTPEMMEVMAQMTNDDPSLNVRAALKYGIESAAELKNPRYWHVSKTAQAVRNIVTSDKLGSEYSYAMFYDGYDSNDSEGDSYYRETSNIASEETMVPKHQRARLQFKNGGWSRRHNFEFSFSSVQDFIDYFKHMVLEPRKSNVDQKYSAKKIIDLLKIKLPSRVPLESSFYTDAYNYERYLSFDEDDLNRLVEDVRQYLKDVEKGVEFHYTKVFYSKQISVMFPIATGVPFIYKYKEPIVIHIKSKASGKFDNDKKTFKDFSANMAKELQITVAMNIDGSVGFMDTISNNLASAGVIRKYQINVPVKLYMEMKSGEYYKMKVEPLIPDQDTSIAHYSVWPYSALQKKDSFNPPSEDSTTKVVERTKKVASIDYKFGQQIGTVFQLQGYSYSKNYRYINSLPFWFYNFGDLIAQQDLALTHVNLRYLGKQSKNKAVTFTAVYDEYHNQKQSGELGPAYKTEDVTVNSASRREEMLKRVSSGFNYGTVKILDLGATFEGQQKEEYVFTTAVAYGPVDPKSQAIVFLGRNSVQHGNWHSTVVAKFDEPLISHLNFLEALKKDIKTTYEVDVLYGETSNINLKGSAERSQKYTELLRQHPLTRRCVHEIENDNHFQTACYEMMVLAHTPDVMKASVTYRNANSTYIYWPMQTYSMLKQENNGFDQYYTTENVAEGSLELKAEAWYMTNSLRLDVTTSKGVFRFNNVQIPDYTPYLLSSYAPFGIWGGFEYFRNYETDNRYQPFCTIDGKSIRTFSDRTYKYELSKSWHLVMHQEEQERGKWGELVMLSRRPSEKQLELYLSLKTETGLDLEIEFGPSAVNNKAEVTVTTKSKKISDGDAITYWDDVAEAPLLQYYTYSDNVLIFNIQDGRLRVIYDGQRLVISTSEYRKTTRGICGQNTGEPRDDYRTPKGLFVDHPEHYGAFYALSVENSDPQTEKFKKEAQKLAYESKTKYTAIIFSDNEWSQAAEKAYKNYGYQNVYRTRSYQQYTGQCAVVQQVQYHEYYGEICITTTPIASCQSQCHGQNYKVQYAQVVCKPKVDKQFLSYKEQIKKGENPQVSGVPKFQQYRVPSSCTV